MHKICQRQGRNIHSYIRQDKSTMHQDPQHTRKEKARAMFLTGTNDAALGNSTSPLEPAENRNLTAQASSAEGMRATRSCGQCFASGKRVTRKSTKKQTAEKNTRLLYLVAAHSLTLSPFLRAGFMQLLLSSKQLQ